MTLTHGAGTQTRIIARGKGKKEKKVPSAMSRTEKAKPPPHRAWRPGVTEYHRCVVLQVGIYLPGRCLSETVPLRWLLPASYILCIRITLRSTWAQDPAGSGRTDQSGKLPALFELLTCEFQGFPTGVMHADINLRCASKGGFPPVCRVDSKS